MMELVQYRDAGMHTYTYFWVDSNKKVISPYFNSEKEAMIWANRDTWDSWKPIKDIV
jgi:hypothetical protein